MKWFLFLLAFVACFLLSVRADARCHGGCCGGACGVTAVHQVDACPAAENPSGYVLAIPCIGTSILDTARPPMPRPPRPPKPLPPPPPAPVVVVPPACAPVAGATDCGACSESRLPRLKATAKAVLRFPARCVKAVLHLRPGIVFRRR